MRIESVFWHLEKLDDDGLVKTHRFLLATETSGIVLGGIVDLLVQMSEPKGL